MTDETNYRTQQIWVKEGHPLFLYFREQTQEAKNLYNTVNFYIRQIYTALTQNKPLQPLQQEVMDTLHQYIQPMNEVQTAAYEKKVESAQKKSVDKQKEVKCNQFTLPNYEKPFISYGFLDCLFKVMKQENYRSLPIQSSQWVLKSVFQNWTSFFESLKDYKINRSKYTGKPRIPKYSRGMKKEIQYTNQDCVIKDNKYLKFPLTKLRLNIGKLGITQGKLKQVRVIPKYRKYVIELVFDIQPEIREFPKDRWMALDLGITNLATITMNTGANPVLIKGNHVKSINQYYNKMKAYYTAILRHGKTDKEGTFTSKRLEKLHETRHRKIKDIFHKVSHYIIELAIEQQIGSLVIGKNQGWKQEINIGKRNNQSFVHIPHNLLIQMIKYKAQQYGIRVIVSEESYTSKASYLDQDDIPTYGQTDTSPVFSGKRINRGLYRSRHGHLINADVNGSANILKKTILRVRPDIVFDWKNIRVECPLVYVA